MRKKTVLVSALLGLVGFAACQSSEDAQTPNKDNAALQVVFVPTCGSPGDRIKIQVNADSCIRRDPANPDARATVVAFRPGYAYRQGQVGSFVPAPPYSRAEVSGEARNYTLDLVVPEGAETGTVDIVGCGNLLDEHVVSPSVFTIPCPPGTTDAGDAGTDASAPKESWAGEIRISYNPWPSPLGNGMAAFYKATSPAEETALAQLEANVKKQTLGSGLPVGTCGQGAPPSPDPAGLPQVGIDVGTPLELRESAGSSAILSLDRGDRNFYMGSMASSMTPGGSPYFFWVPGGGGVPPTTFEGLQVPVKPVITQPAEGASISKASDYTIEFEPFVADAFVITIGTTPSFKCNADPQAGSIVVPAAQLSQLPNGYALFDFRATNSTDHPLTIDGEARRITTSRVLSFMIGGTLN